MGFRLIEVLEFLNERRKQDMFLVEVAIQSPCRCSGDVSAVLQRQLYDDKHPFVVAEIILTHGLACHVNKSIPSHQDFLVLCIHRDILVQPVRLISQRL